MTLRKSASYTNRPYYWCGIARMVVTWLKETGHFKHDELLGKNNQLKIINSWLVPLDSCSFLCWQVKREAIATCT